MLLKGGKPVHTDKKFRVFEKRGSMEKALLDFYSVGPTDVLPFKVPGQVCEFSLTLTLVMLKKINCHAKF